MTDTTNHAEAIRKALLRSDIDNLDYETAVDALDALTRELEEARASEQLVKGLLEGPAGALALEGHLRDTIAAQSARIATLEEAALKAVEDEAEFPGDIPDDLYGLLRELAKNDDRGAITESLRIIVRLTKRGIAERLRAALAPSKGER